MKLLNENNFLLYAAKYYDNPECLSIEEFKADVKRLFYIKKLCTRYKEEENIKSLRLILNHLIIMNNLFGPVPTARMLFLKMPENFDVLKPILVYLGIMPDYFINIKKSGTSVNCSNIYYNKEIEKEIEKI